MLAEVRQSRDDWKEQAARVTYINEKEPGGTLSATMFLK